MAGISTTGLGLPAATSALVPTARDVDPGPWGQGTGGSTSLPAAAPADFQSGLPTPLDRPHPTYPTLIQSHVAVLQAIGTPEAVISALAEDQPQAGYLDRYIQGEIMQNPEGWDDYVGNPRGTARAGLQQLMPGVQLPPAGTGRPGYLADGSPVSGIDVPGLSTPLLNPSTGAPAGDGGAVKLAIAAAAIVGVGLLAWKLFKGGGGGGDVAKQAAAAFGGGAGAAGGLDGLQEAGRRLVTAGVDANDLSLVQRGMTMGLLGGGAGAAAAVPTSTAATAWGVMQGLAPGQGDVMAIHAAAKFAGISDVVAHRIAMDHRWMGVLERLASNGGTLGDAATAGVLARQAMGAAGTAGAGGAHLEGLRQVLAGVANAI